jgi:hypothetical protein
MAITQKDRDDFLRRMGAVTEARQVSSGDNKRKKAIEREWSDEEIEEPHIADRPHGTYLRGDFRIYFHCCCRQILRNQFSGELLKGSVTPEAGVDRTTGGWITLTTSKVCVYDVRTEMGER